MIPLSKIGLRLNPYGANFSPLAKSTLSINVCHRQSIADILAANAAGYPVYAICGLEIKDAGFPDTKEGLRSLLREIGPYISGGTKDNEWNVARMHPDVVREKNAWAAEVFAEFRIPFAISSTLSHTWLQFGSRQIGWIGTPGWPGLIDVYPGGLADLPKQYDGTPAMIDIHLYTQAELASEQPAYWLETMLSWWTKGAVLYDNETYRNSPFKDARYVVGEFGYKVDGGHCYVSDAFNGLFSEGVPKQLVSALYFCNSDIGLPPSQYYGLHNDGGSEKSGAINDYNWCVAQYQEAIGEPIPVPHPTPTPQPTPQPTPPASNGGYELGFLEYYRQHPEIGVAAGPLDYWKNKRTGDELALQYTQTGRLEWQKSQDRVIHYTKD